MNLTELLASLSLGTFSAVSIIHFSPSLVPDLRSAVSYQDSTVLLYSDLFPSEKSRLILSDWSSQKALANSRISDLEELGRVSMSAE